MKSEHTKLRQEQRQEQTAIRESEQQQAVREFGTVEELLRFDNEQNPVPADVAERLNASIAVEPQPAKPWYKNLFGL